MTRREARLRDPMGVNRNAILVIPANPIHKLGAAFIRRNFHGVMGAADPHTLFGQFLDHLKMIPAGHGVPATTVHVKKHRRCAIEGRGFIRPAIGVHHRLDARHAVQAFL